MLPIAELESLPSLLPDFLTRRLHHLDPTDTWKSVTFNIHTTSYRVLLLLDSPSWSSEVGLMEWPLCCDLYLTYWI